MGLSWKSGGTRSNSWCGSSIHSGRQKITSGLCTTPAFPNNLRGSPKKGCLSIIQYTFTLFYINYHCLIYPLNKDFNIPNFLVDLAGKVGSAGKESACNTRDLGSVSELGRSPGEGKGYPLQCSGLENSMDYVVHGVANSQRWLSNFHFHEYPGIGYWLLYLVLHFQYLSILECQTDLKTLRIYSYICE